MSVVCLKVGVGLWLCLWPSLPSAFNAQHIHVSKDNFGFMACEIPRLLSDYDDDDEVTHSGRPNGVRCISIEKKYVKKT